MTFFTLFYPASGYLGTPHCCRTRQNAENDKSDPFYAPTAGGVHELAVRPLTTLAVIQAYLQATPYQLHLNVSELSLQVPECCVVHQ